MRDAGLAVNNEELAYGLRSIAVPVRARTGDVVAAINLAVHRSMVSMDDLIGAARARARRRPRRDLRARRLPRRSGCVTSVAVD